MVVFFQFMTSPFYLDVKIIVKNYLHVKIKAIVIGCDWRRKPAQTPAALWPGEFASVARRAYGQVATQRNGAREEMTTLVVGASGATGRLLVRQLLERGEQVRAVVRSTGSLPDDLKNHERLSIVTASILELSDNAMVELVSGCRAVASCLGHNLNFKGLFGPPYRLVTDAVRRLSVAVQADPPAAPVKFVLMNTTGNRNRDLDEPISFGQKCVIGLLRALLPPHADNECAADFLRTAIGQHHDVIAWCAVRPDGLINQTEVTPFDVHPSPTRSAIFDAGQTSRINVACFMADLIGDDDVWQQWKGQMPVVYNRDQLKE
ncbi:MAG: NAD(P)H-binding protein [Gammaproteobacteria bacterium]